MPVDARQPAQEPPGEPRANEDVDEPAQEHHACQSRRARPGHQSRNRKDRHAERFDDPAVRRVLHHLDSLKEAPENTACPTPEQGDPQDDEDQPDFGGIMDNGRENNHSDVRSHTDKCSRTHSVDHNPARLLTFAADGFGDRIFAAEIDHDAEDHDDRRSEEEPPVLFRPQEPGEDEHECRARDPCEHFRQ